MSQTDFYYHCEFKTFDGSRMGDYAPDEAMRRYFNLRELLHMLTTSFEIELSYSRVYRELATDLVSTSTVRKTERTQWAGRGDARVLLIIYRTLRPPY